MTRCLIVDDDHAIRTLLQEYLRGFGFEVEVVEDGAGLRHRLPEGGIDVLLLDLMLPDENGLALCQWAKKVAPTLPVIMLTAQGDPLSRVLGLELGADDYLPKPFELRELVARIKAVLRRGNALMAAKAAGAPLRIGSWQFDRIQRRLISPEGVVVPLSATEFRLLSVFVDHPGQVLGREKLLALSSASGTAAAGLPSDRSIDLAVSRLRSKLGTDAGSPLIWTVRGEGYRFDPGAVGGP
ncbi:response regulator transcription factor [Ideonella sp. YS5]|uniref:response regulator transcription factor n=1 Tax=Ideonella sp. YS5 TaxID=3453714 RepID=UPI003EEF2E01